MSFTDCFISVVIPVYNEEKNLHQLIKRLVDVLQNYKDYEIIFTNNDSLDSTREIITNYLKENDKIKLINLSRNFGHQASLSSGLLNVSGDVVMVMDGDLQDPPEVIPEFVDKWHEGFDVVYAIRKKRKESIFKRMAYFAFYRILRRVSDIDIPIDSGDFSIMDRRVVDQMNQFPEKNRFVRGVRAFVGYKQTGLEYKRDKRFAGETKYSLSSLIKLSYDGIFSFSKRPIQMASYLGLLMTFLSFAFVIYLFARKLVFGISIEGWTSLIVAITFIGGIQTLMIGVIGEYIGRIFDEVKGRPYFVVKDTLNLENPKSKIQDL